MPIYRPLIAFEKEEIRELAKKALLGGDDQVRFSKTPSTKVSSDVILQAKSSLKMESLVETAVAKRMMIPIMPECSK